MKRNSLGLVAVAILLTGALLPRSGLAADDAADVDTLLRQREPELMLSPLKEAMRERVEHDWTGQIMLDATYAERVNDGVSRPRLYANPAVQRYINQLGQSLIPREASEGILVSFKVIEDPKPYSNALSTGTVYISTGLISLLDNESQLAFLLMHEAGHVLLSHDLYELLEVERAEKKARRNKIIGAVAGAVVGKAAGGREDMFAGAGLGVIGGSFFGGFRARKFTREVQQESDDFATTVLLNASYDVREAPVLMAKVGDVVHRSNAAVGLAFGYGKDLPKRKKRLQQLLGGVHQPAVARILAGEGFQMTSPRFHQLMSELKRDNGFLALQYDLFTIARLNLEEASAIRTDDAVTQYYLGLLYRAVARSDEDRNKSANYFKAAIHFDTERHRFPEARLQYAVELIALEDPSYYPDIQRALKSYVSLYQRNYGGQLPREMNFVYDYLELTGDRTWKAYRVNNVASEAPYQLTGDPTMDRVADSAPAGGGT